MNTKKLLLILVLGSWIAAGSLAYGQYGTTAGTQANTASDVTIPAGTGVSVRTNETIDSHSATEGQTYSAVVVDDVAVLVMTRSPSFKPSCTSVLLPSLMPVFTDTAERTGLPGADRSLSSR